MFVSSYQYDSGETSSTHAVSEDTEQDPCGPIANLEEAYFAPDR